MANIGRVDLNLLVYLDVLLRERNVTRAANYLGVSQPAMSNGLRRLRELFGDPLLVRTSEGMTPTERAKELEPIVRKVLSEVDKAVQPKAEFDPASSEQVFRIVTSDYAEATLVPELLRRLRDEAPGVSLDIMTPSDVSFHDVEQGKVDLVINRFDDMPQSFHQTTVWEDDFVCLLSAENPIAANFNLESYLQASHVWVSKTGMGVGVGVNPADVQRLGWVDVTLNKLGKKRHITVFTRHYQSAMLLAEQKDLVVTIPRRSTTLLDNRGKVLVMEPPFEIPSIELKMAWSPLLHHNPAHQWVRRLISDLGQYLSG